MDGSYRGQIVESEAQRLARAAQNLEAERERYRRAWQRIRRSRWVVPGVALVACVSGASLIVAVTPGLAFWLIAALLMAVAWTVNSGGWGKCPHCGQQFLSSNSNPHERGHICSSCRIPFGYFPTAEDLDDNEPGPG